jgi:hypothetical protein
MTSENPPPVQANLGLEPAGAPEPPAQSAPPTPNAPNTPPAPDTRRAGAPPERPVRPRDTLPSPVTVDRLVRPRSSLPEPVAVVHRVRVSLLRPARTPETGPESQDAVIA